MCRIAGIANRTLRLPEIQTLVTAMCDAQKHGGPDDSGLYSCEKTSLVLGHRRLALIDLSAGGHQPMCYQNKYIISFNGEIYNYKDLKNRLLQSGSAFQTNSDTEVILAAFDTWGTQSFEKLSGMFAFALYDIAGSQLYLVRDASGIKPLYYSETSTSLEFASEMRAFNYLKKKENRNWPVYQLAYGHIPEPVTTLEKVQPLHKGCFYKYNLLTGENSLQSFKHYSFSSDITDRGLAVKEIGTAIQNAVCRHLVADASIGVFLSGGVDSSIITTVAAKYRHRHLQTLSLYFNEPLFSEKTYQDQVIDQLKCKHYQHLLQNEEFENSFSSILEAMDMPSCDGINTWFISKYARENGLKAVLSGIGGDELFGGYPSFGRINAALSLQRMPPFIQTISGKSSRKQVNRLQYLKLDGVKGLYLFLRGQFIPREIAKQLNASEKEIWSVLEDEPVYSELNSLSAKNEASWIETNLYMQNQLLRDADVMSMAHGIEIRVPLLDDELIAKVSCISPGIKYQGILAKQLLIDAFKDSIPATIWNRKKMGFSFPFTQWLSDSVFVKETIAESNTASKKNYQKFLEGKLHWSSLMSLVILQKRGIA